MRYTLENEFLTITADSKGAELVSAVNRETGREMMWTGDPAVWGRHAPLLFPYPGRLWQGKYRLDGKIYEGGAHGILRDSEFTRENSPADALVLRCRWSEKSMEKFPRKFQVTVRFTLDRKQVHQQIRVENLDDRTMKFGFGYHPGFCIPFDENHKTEDYEIRFDTPQSPIVVEADGGYDSGRTHILMENRTAIPMTDRMFDDDSIGIRGLTAKTISLYEKDTGKNVTVDIAGFPYTLLWSMPGNPQLHFVCLEPWHNIQDKVDSPLGWEEKPGAAVLQPGESWDSCLSITFNR